MIIKTVKWNKRLCVTILIGLGVVLVALVLLFGALGRGNNEANRAANNEDRVRYLASLGWEVGADPLEEKEVLIPQKFSGVFEEYNLQIPQGIDWSRYAGEKATLYSYQVMNYPSPDTVLADLYIVGNRVVAGDIHSTALDGFMHALILQKN
jgi:hypothetical protein